MSGNALDLSLDDLIKQQAKGKPSGRGGGRSNGKAGGRGHQQLGVNKGRGAGVAKQQQQRVSSGVHARARALQRADLSGAPRTPGYAG
jgi:hypothetical protein